VWLTTSMMSRTNAKLRGNQALNQQPKARSGDKRLRGEGGFHTPIFVRSQIKNACKGGSRIGFYMLSIQFRLRASFSCPKGCHYKSGQCRPHGAPVITSIRRNALAAIAARADP
jgi:hypothetical protein